MTDHNIIKSKFKIEKLTKEMLSVKGLLALKLNIDFIGRRECINWFNQIYSYDSTPNFKLNQSISNPELIDNIGKIINLNSNELFIFWGVVEKLLSFQIKISDKYQFFPSFWEMSKSHDLLLFDSHSGIIFTLHVDEIEYFMFWSELAGISEHE